MGNCCGLNKNKKINIKKKDDKPIILSPDDSIAIENKDLIYLKQPLTENKISSELDPIKPNEVDLNFNKLTEVINTHLEKETPKNNSLKQKNLEEINIIENIKKEHLKIKSNLSLKKNIDDNKYKEKVTTIVKNKLIRKNDNPLNPTKFDKKKDKTMKNLSELSNIYQSLSKKEQRYLIQMFENPKNINSVIANKIEEKIDNNQLLPLDEIKLKAELGNFHIEFKAQKCERMIMYWVNAGSRVIFSTNGLWAIDRDIYGFTDENGYSPDNIHEKCNGFNMGALLGRVMGSKFSFAIKDKLEYISEVSGPLFLSMNMSESFIHSDSIRLEGVIDVLIKNAEPLVGFEQLEYNYNKKLFNINEIKFSEATLFEKKLVDVLNKLRDDPKLFASLYLGGETLIPYLPNNRTKKRINLKEIIEENYVNYDKAKKNSKLVLKKSNEVNKNKSTNTLFIEPVKEENFISKKNLYSGVKLLYIPMQESNNIVNKKNEIKENTNHKSTIFI